jgi:hypothetical protein
MPFASVRDTSTITVRRSVRDAPLHEAELAASLLEVAGYRCPSCGDGLTLDDTLCGYDADRVFRIACWHCNTMPPDKAKAARESRLQGVLAALVAASGGQCYHCKAPVTLETARLQHLTYHGSPAVYVPVCGSHHGRLVLGASR